MTTWADIRRRSFGALFGLAIVLGAVPAAAQIRSIDPNAGIDADLEPLPNSSSSPSPAPAPATSSPSTSYPTATDDPYRAPGDPEQPGTTTSQAPASSGTVEQWKDSDFSKPVVTSSEASSAASQAAGNPEVAAAQGSTYKKDDLIGAAEGVFGKGAEGLARMIESLLDKQGEPNAYIVGREGGGAIVFGLRYGSGTLYHKVEGQMPVYWTGPSVGFDVGGNAGNTFVLVYNLFDTEDLYKRYPAGEGQAYVIGGFTASYLRRGDKVLIPIRAGVGVRLGVNAGYMKFSKKQRWVPF